MRMSAKWGFLLAIVMLVAFGSGCSDSGSDPSDVLDDLEAPDDFDYSTTQPVRLILRSQTSAGEAIGGVRFNVFETAPDNNNLPSGLLFVGATNSGGLLETDITVKKTVDSLYVQADFVGLLNHSMVPIVNGELRFTLGQPVSGANKWGSQRSFLPKGGAVADNPPYSYLGSYDGNGVPDYLESERDELGVDLLEDINAAFPEWKPVPEYNPDYLASGNELNLVLTEEADVYVTFVHEGAGYLNTLGYYTYPAGSPPTDIDDIDSVYISFPNASYDGGGGGLVAGDKVKLGTFGTDVEIGWVLIADAWNGSSVGSGNNIYFSDPDLNPESSAATRQHLVSLYDVDRDLVLIGWEDLFRDGGTDDDFNDAIFYVTTDPAGAIDGDDMPPVEEPEDTDGDGVDDPVDEYPEDPDRAFDNPYPGEDQYYTLAFEDDWPAAGDYDFNDMIIDYNYMRVTNAANDVVDIIASFVVRASGTDRENGFGIQLGTTAANIASVSGTQYFDSYISTEANGVESGHTDAVIIVFDNVQSLMNPPSGDLVNTRKGIPYIEPDTLTVTITLSSAASLAGLGTEPYNPFIIVDADRDVEVHLADQAPTQLASNLFFGTGADDSDLIAGTYYKTAANIPWGLDISAVWDYPFEGVAVSTAHLFFGDWLTSGGATYPDWYQNLSGYRVDENIYSPFGIGKRR